MAKLLLVEDNLDDAELALRTLQKTVFAVDTTSTLEQAVSRLKETDYDAVLLDLSLADSFKEETVSRLKREHPHIAVIVLTGFKDVETLRKAIVSNASNVLLKGSDDQDADYLASQIMIGILNNMACLNMDTAAKVIRVSDVSEEALAQLEMALERSKALIEQSRALLARQWSNGLREIQQGMA